MCIRDRFNALLKTLEEPPEHVKFIFATTEIRKVPITILSRCQRFDLQIVPSKILIDHLKWVCEEEKINFTLEALQIIVRVSGGSVRDAISLLLIAGLNFRVLIQSNNCRNNCPLISLCVSLLPKSFISSGSSSKLKS